MVLPHEIKTRNKIRDAGIVNAWQGGETQEAIAERLGMTRNAIYSILRKNREIMKLDKDFEKAKRLHYLHNALANSKPSEKDRLDILEALRKEIEGDKNIQVTNNSYVLYRNADAVREEKQDAPVQTRQVHLQ